MKILRVSSTLEATTIHEAVRVLKAGGMVVYPTETCYGVGVDSTNGEAVEKLLNYKGARGGKAISVAVADVKMAKRYVNINETAKHIYANFLPGPVTVISKSKDKVARALVSDQGALGIRIPKYPLVLNIIQKFNKPVTATSANTSGKKPPYSLNDWQKYTTLPRRQMIDLFIDAGELPERLPSTVLDTTLNEPTVLRQGEIVVPQSAISFGSASEAETRQVGEKIMCAYKQALVDKPVILALQGELGSGKTQLAKGVAKALGISRNVPSPTYMIIREYEFNKQKFYHIDTWRLHEGMELWSLGLKEMLKPGNVVVIEWQEKIKQEIEKLKGVVIVWVEIQVTGKETRRIRYFSV
jgi:L-threonylcarbamoyladenylate synthase